MNKLEVIKQSVTKMTGKGGLLVKKYSPEILLVVGIGGVIGSTVMACKNTSKAEHIIDLAGDRFDAIKEIMDNPEKYEDHNYTEKDAQKDKLTIMVQTGVSLAKVYGPSITLGATSIVCILGSHNIMKKRNVALIAAYKAVESSFTDYRKRVVSEFGLKKDHQFKNGIFEEEITETITDEDGKKKKVKTIVETLDPNHTSQYARFFDNGSQQWSKTPEYNLVFLKAQQNYANDLLHARGHVFLNEVYDMLGIPRTQAGSVVGWYMNPDGDNFIDFGMYDLNDSNARDFVNGHERSILLDFNVDGVMYDLI